LNPKNTERADKILMILSAASMKIVVT